MLLQTINFLQQQVTLDVGAHFYDPKAIIIRLNHSKLAEAVCSWAGVPQERQQNVAEVQYFVSPVPHICGIISADTFFFCVCISFSLQLLFSIGQIRLIASHNGVWFVGNYYRYKHHNTQSNHGGTLIVVVLLINKAYWILLQWNSCMNSFFLVKTI